MNKPVRKAVRCYVIKKDKVLVIQYNQNNHKKGYYDIPGGKIEENETPFQAVIREVKEETNLDVLKIKRKGKMIIEYPSNIFDLDVFVCQKFEGIEQESSENKAEWIDVSELLKKEKILPTILLLDPFFRKGLQKDGCEFSLKVEVSQKEEILGVCYQKTEEHEDATF